MEVSEGYQKVELKGRSPRGAESKDGQSFLQFGQGGSVKHYRLAVLCLALLDIILLVAAIAIGICCIKLNQGLIVLPQDSVAAFTVELNFLQSNHSNVMRAKEEDKKALVKEAAIHKELVLQLKELKELNDNLHNRIEELKLEQKYIKSNNSMLEENCGHCPPQWTYLNTKCYFFSNPASASKLTWLESREDCINRGSDLVVIDTWEEQKIISDNLPNLKTTGVWWENGFWIGLTDVMKEGTWVWVNNVTQHEPFYWIEGEPNNHGLQGENCAALYSRGNPKFTWYDGKCNHHRYRWICEMTP